MGVKLYRQLLNKTVLIGITYYTHDNEFIEQKQYHGKVVEANKKNILIKLSDGSDFSLPPDLSAFDKAAKGEYRLRSTGEVVVNPDYTSTWTLTAPKEKSE